LIQTEKNTINVLPNFAVRTGTVYEKNVFSEMSVSADSISAALTDSSESECSVFTHTRPRCSSISTLNVAPARALDFPDPVETAANSLFSGGDLTGIDENLIPPLILHLQSIRDRQLDLDDVHKAEATDDLIQRVDAYRISCLKLKAQKALELNYMERIRKAKVDLASLDLSVRETLDSIRTKQNGEEIQLKSRQAAEIESFNQHWQSPRVIRHFNKASAQLQTLRRQSVALCTSRRVEEFHLKESEMKSLETRERSERYRVMSMNYEAQLKQLHERHRLEFEVLEQTKERTEQTFLSAAAVEIDRANKRIQALESSLRSVSDVERVWNLHHRFEKRPVKAGREPTRFSKNRGRQFPSTSLGQSKSHPRASAKRERALIHPV
jgi:hypothetical protein